MKKLIKKYNRDKRLLLENNQYISMTKNISLYHIKKPVRVQTFVSKRSAQTQSSRLHISLTASEDH